VSPAADRGRVGALDAIRGLGATAIVAFHVMGIGDVPLPDSLGFVRSHLGMGVTIFFVLSAFSLFRTNDQRRHTEPSFVQRFFVRRVARLCPLFYAMIAFWVVARWLEFGETTPVGDVILTACFAFNPFPGSHESIVWAGWTLGVEAIFYALLPLVFRWVLRPRDAMLLAAATLVVSHFSHRIMTASGDLPVTFVYMSFLTHAPVFAVGICSYYGYLRVRDLAPGTLRWLSWAVLAWVPALYWAIPWLGLEPSRPVSFALWSAVFGAITAVHACRTNLLVTNPVTVFLGRTSYSVYLLHPFLVYKLQPLYRAVEKSLAGQETLAFVICFLLTMAVVSPLAELSYRFIERPGIDLGRRWLARPAPVGANTSAT